MNWALLAVALLGAYLLGSIPTSYLLVKWRKGIDIRSIGSGNVGATNTVRALGFGWGGTCLLLDALKGVLAVLLLRMAFAQSPDVEWLACAGGVFAILGHSLPVWLSFKGGKGVATSTGVFLALAPVAVLIAAVVVLTIIGVTHYVSLGSLVGALLLPAMIFFLEGMGPVFYLSIGAALFVIIRHRANVKRLLNGTENKFGRPKQEMN